MSAPLFLVDPGLLDHVHPGDDFDLGGDEGRHAGAVQRLRVGERVEIADGVGTRLTCLVTSASKAGLSLRIDERRNQPAPALRLALAQALAKGDRDELAIATATELGVDRIVPWQAERSVVVWRGERAAKSYWRWQATVRAAAKQSRRAWVPVVEQPVDTAALAADVERIVARGGAALILHEDASGALAEVDLPHSGEVLVVVGPEGGISDRELSVLTKAGGVGIRVGEPILRTSTAGPAVLAVLSYLSGRWQLAD